MLRSALRVRVAAPFALAALTLGMPSLAFAETTPAPSAATSESIAPAPAPSDSVSETQSPTPSPTTSSPSTPSSPTPTPTPTVPTTPTTPNPTSSPDSPTVAPARPAPPTASQAPNTRQAAPDPTFTVVPLGSLELQQGRYAAHFLATQLAKTGNHLNYPDAGFGIYPDTGNTIDAVLALDATGTGGTAAAAATTWVEQNVKDYVAYGGGPASVGGAGKALVLAAVQGRDPHAFGGLDLIATLQDLVTAEGRFGAADNDYGVTINQALPMIGLDRAGVAIPATSLAFLAKQQCADGGVRGSLDATTCVSDPDATAFAAQAFLAADDTAHATPALNYLESRQRTDGSMANASGEGANANTTGVAAQAFALGGREVPYLKAASFIMSLQWTCGVPAENRGGIPFTAADRAVTKANVEKAIRATPQAVLGLLGGSLVTVENDDVVATTTATPCVAPPSTATASPTTSAAATVSPSAKAPVAGGPSVPQAGGAPLVKGSGSGLAYTGASVLAPLGIALLLLLAGAATILVSRRRGAHQ